MSALWRCTLVSEVQCTSLSRGIGRSTCIHVATRHTCGGQHARGTSDYTGLFYVECGVGSHPVSSPVPGASGSRSTGTSTVQRGPLQALARSMIDLQHRVTGLEREPSPAPSLSSPLLSLGATPSDVVSVPDSIFMEGPGVTVSLDYVPAGIYKGRRVWSVSVPEEDS